jgi:phosphatidylserine decarboxylase
VKSLKSHALLKEGIPTLIVVLIITFILYLIYPWAALLGVSLLLFVLYFFRDPKRTPKETEGVILAPADGLVTGITEVEENSFLNGKATRIDIFLSPMNVHINRSPISGQVVYHRYQKGKFIPATNPKYYDVNEKNFIGIEGAIRVLVVQVAGIMARRVVDWTRDGMKVQAGDKIGMIKFSSGTQIYIPADIPIEVKTGDRIVSGITVIGRIPS